MKLTNFMKRPEHNNLHRHFIMQERSLHEKVKKTLLLKTLLLLSISLSFIGCKTSVNVQAPKESYIATPFTPRSSVVSMTTETKISDIQKSINAQISGLIYEDNSLDNNNSDNVMVKAWKQGDIRLSMDDNVISFQVPLKVWIKAGFSVQKFGLSISDYRELNGALSLKFRTAVTLNPDWTITTRTTSEGYEWLTTPTLKIAGVDFSVKFIADILLQAGLKKVGTIIDESIKDYLNLRPYATQAWELAQQPLLLDETYNAWLQITPAKVISSNLMSVDGTIRHKAGITGTILININPPGKTTLSPQTGIDNNTPVANIPADISPKDLKPLPDILIGNVPVDVSTIYTYILLPFTELNAQARHYVKGKTFSQGKRSVMVEEIKLYGNEGSIIAETRLSGSLNGTIYFRGRPVYQSTDSTLVIEDFDYDLSTKNFLVKSASWLYQDGFRRMIAKELKWSLSKEIMMVNQTINDNLHSLKLTSGVTLHGQINRIEPASIKITSEGIIPEVIATGKVGIIINP